MVDTDFYSLIGDDLQGGVPPSWFSAQLARYKTNSDILKDFYLAQEVSALKAFHDGVATTEQAANAITRPISTNPVPSVGTSSDEIVAITQLWRLYKDALVEWPSNRTQDLVALGVAISGIPDQIHRGEALDDDEDQNPLTWQGLPALYMVWRDAHWMHPSDIVQQCRDDTAARQRARDVYLKQQDVEARLVAVGIFKYKFAFRSVITALEKAKRSDDHHEHEPAREGDLEPLELDFHIPAAARWIKHNGQRVYTSIVKEELKDLEEQDIPRGARQFDRPADRWKLWEQRFSDVARDGLDDFTKAEAQAAVTIMRDIRSNSEGEKT